MKTIKQIADEIGVSKQAVYKRVKGKLRESLLQYIHTVDGIVHIEEQGETLIKCDFVKETVSIGAHTECSNGVPIKTPLDTVIDILNNNNEILKKELEVKNSQLEVLQAELAEERKHNRELTDKIALLADNAQKLHAGTLQQLMDGDVSADESEPTVPNRGFLSIFIKKKKKIN